MMVVGIVSLPGMMTGQLLAGTSPVEAVKYQIVIMFLIASGAALGTVLGRFFSAFGGYSMPTISLCALLADAEQKVDDN